MKRIILISMAVLFILPAFSAQAFDDYRRGFILGIGVGKYETTVTDEDAFLGTSREQDINNGTGFTLRIGGGVSDHVLMYGFYDIGVHEETNGSGLKEDVGIGFVGLGMSIYITPRSHSVYFNGGVGVACSATEDTSAGGDVDYCGTGTTVGIGLELGAGASLELNRTVLSLEHDTNSDLTRDFETTRAMFMYTWY